VNAAVLTVSDRCSRGEYEDVGGPLVGELLEAAGARIVARDLVPDEQGLIEDALVRLAGDPGVDLVVTTGGTGLSPRDVTPEATRAVIDREVPGLAEVMRARGAQVTPMAALSRQVCGLRAGTLIVNLPGSPKAIREGLDAIAPVLEHAVRIARGEVVH
jgi:molybdopterin adenylyltransferase